VPCVSGDETRESAREILLELAAVLEHARFSDRNARFIRNVPSPLAMKPPFAFISGTTRNRSPFLALRVHTLNLA